MVADFRERYSSRKPKVLSFITRVENLVYDDDISTSLSKLDIPNCPEWISKEDFITMRQSISEAVPSIIVAGTSSSGKSSLINAILGEDLLPTSHNASTAVMCQIKYSGKDGKKMAIAYFDQEETRLMNLDDEGDREKFKAIVTKPRETIESTSGHVAARVTVGETAVAREETTSEEFDKVRFCRKVVVLWPKDFLKDLVLIDSPGILYENDDNNLKIMKAQCEDDMPCGLIFVLDASKAAQESAKVKGLPSYILRTTNRIPSPGSALFVANKWDLVKLYQKSRSEQEQIRKELLTMLTKEWPGFQEHQLITMSCTESASGLKTGCVNSEMSQLCSGIKKALAQGSDHIFVSSCRACLNLVESIASSTERTVCYFNMPLDKRIAKFQNESKKLKKLKNDFKNGRLGRQRRKLMTKIEETALALEQQLTSKEQHAKIKQEAIAQSEHQGLFFPWGRKDYKSMTVQWFTAEQLEMSIAESELVMEVKQWAEDTLMVEDACSALDIPYTAIARPFKDLETPDYDFLIKGQNSSSVFSWLCRYVPFILHGWILLPVTFFCLTKKYSNSLRNMDRDFDYEVNHILFCPIESFRRKCLFVSEVVKRHKSTVAELLNDNPDGLLSILKDILMWRIRSVRFLMADLPKYIEELEAELKMRAELEEKDKEGFQSMLHKAENVRRELAVLILTLNVHTWRGDSVSIYKEAAGKGSFCNAHIKTNDKRATAKLIDLKMNDFHQNTAAVATILPRVTLKDNSVIEFYGSVLLDPDALKMGLLFEWFEPIIEEISQAVTTVNVKTVTKMAVDVSNALCYLHDNRINLRGFSSENLKKTADGRVKLFPPPYGKQLWHTICLEGPFIDDLAYASPEVLLHWPCDDKADIYSMGILLSEFWAGHRPYSESGTRGQEIPKTAAAFAEAIVAGRVRPSSLFDPPTHRQLDDIRIRWHSLAVECWKSEPSERPRAKHVKERLQKSCL